MPLLRWQQWVDRARRQRAARWRRVAARRLRWVARWQQSVARWPVYARWTLIGVPLTLAGLLIGLSVYVVSHRVFTGDVVVERPATASAFSWPLRLARRANVLIIGLDTAISPQAELVSVSRADTLMLITFDPARERVGILSVPRDIRMIIPGLGESKINATYPQGGPALTIRAVEDLLGVPVHYYVKLRPESFTRIIDALGGVEIDVEKDMQYTDHAAGLYIDLKQGRQLLSGERAMHYVRFRNDEQSDIGRVQRQQKVLLAILDKVRASTMMAHAPKLLGAFVQNTETNLTLSELITVGLFATQLGIDAFHTATVPGEAGPVYVEPDLAATRQVVTEMFLGVDPAMLAGTAVEVLNGSDVPGLARQTAARLERLGFQIVRVDNAAEPVAATTLFVRTGRPGVAEALAELLGHPAIVEQDGDGPDITIVVGRDIALLYPPEVSAGR